MAEFGLHPTLDNLLVINDAAALHDFAVVANEEYRKDGITVVYQPQGPNTHGMSYVAVDDRSRDSQMVISYALSLGQESPMYVDVTDVTEDGVEVLGRLPILARAAFKWSGEVTGAEIGGDLRTGASLHCTPEMNILTFLEDSTRLEPKMGEFDGEDYRDIDRVISGISCIPQLAELADYLTR